MTDWKDEMRDRTAADPEPDYAEPTRAEAERDFDGYEACMSCGRIIHRDEAHRNRDGTYTCDTCASNAEPPR